MKIREGYFDENAGSYKRISASPTKVYIFCWNKTIAASSNHTKDYYESVKFQDMTLPPDKQLVMTNNKLKDLKSLVLNPRYFPEFVFTNFLQIMTLTCDSQQKVKKLEDFVEEVTFENLLAMEPLEIQLTKATASIIRKAYPELDVKVKK